MFITTSVCCFLSFACMCSFGFMSLTLFLSGLLVFSPMIFVLLPVFFVMFFLTRECKNFNLSSILPPGIKNIP